MKFFGYSEISILNQQTNQNVIPNGDPFKPKFFFAIWLKRASILLKKRYILDCSKSGFFGGVMSKIEFEENWPYGY